MSDFDARLTSRLEHLDRAMPEPAPPDLAAARAAAARRHRRLRRIVPILAVAALLVGAGVVGADRLLYPETPEPELFEALHQAWAGVACMSSDDARAAVRSALDELGKTDWTIGVRPGVDANTGCTAPMIISPYHEVALIGIAGEALSDALGAFRDETFERCLSRGEAREALSSILVAYGMTKYDIHDGPELLYGTGAVPVDQATAYIEHAKHCTLYGGMGAAEDGTPWFRLWGPWP